ncbi:MAG: hypothetical protein V4526_02460 [Patescibacteria group bacterium]
MNETLISWNAYEHSYAPKTSEWYWSVGIITVTAAALSLILSNVIFAIFILVSGFALAIHASKPPRVVNHEINDRGIIIGDTLYPFLDLESFWIDHNHPAPHILIKSHKFFMPYLHIPIDEVDPEDVRKILLTYIAETKHEEPFLLKVLEKFGF